MHETVDPVENSTSPEWDGGDEPHPAGDIQPMPGWVATVRLNALAGLVVLGTTAGAALGTMGGSMGQGCMTH